MDNDGKLEAIKYMCENILDDDSILYTQATCKMILNAILEVIDG